LFIENALFVYAVLSGTGAIAFEIARLDCA